MMLPNSTIGYVFGIWQSSFDNLVIAVQRISPYLARCQAMSISDSMRETTDQMQRIADGIDAIIQKRANAIIEKLTNVK